MATGQEIELKFVAEASDLVKFCRKLSLAGAVCAPSLPAKRLRTIYYDTPDLFCWQAQMALRVRKSGRLYVQSVKNGYGDGGFVRGEWETPAPGGRLDMNLFPDVVADLVPEDRRESLMPVFSTDFRRITRDITLASGARIELALDQGEILAGSRRAPIAELELELKRGRLADLFDAALQLSDIAPLRLAIRSKAERGYELAAGVKPLWHKSKRPGIGADDTVAAALARIVRQGALDVLANEAAVLAGQAEAVHQMRVALRRTRSAFSLFAPALPDGALNELKAETGWLAGALGPARDLDVFLADIIPPVRKAFPKDAGFAAIARRVSAQRALALAAMQAAVGSPRYSGLILRLLAWAEHLASDPRLAGDALAQPIGGFAAQAAERRYRKMLKRGKGFRKLSSEERHQVRIAGKKLRYALEFFGDLWPGRGTKTFLSALRELQDRLGHLNDVATAEIILQQAAPRSAHKDWSEAAKRILDWQGHAMTENLDQTGGLWKRLAKLPVPWE